MAQSGHPEMSAPCPLSGVKRTWLGERVMSASDSDIERSKIPQCSSTRRAIHFIREARELMGSETTRVHHAAWRRGPGVAARGARATARDAAKHWICRQRLA